MPLRKKLGDLLDARARRLVAAILSGLAGRFATLIAPLFAMPAIFHYFGDVRFGLWATSISITSIAVIADLGIGNGLLTRVATAYGGSDFESIRRYVSSAYVALGAIATLLTAVAIAAFFAFSLSSIVLAVFAVFFVGLPGTVFYQFLYAIHKVPTLNILLTFGAVASVTLCLLAVHFGAPAWGVAVAYALPPVLVSFGGAVWFFRTHPEFCPSLGTVEWQYGRDLLRLGSGFFLLSILTAAGLNVDNLIISARIGPAAVGAYSIPMRLGSLLGLVILAIFMPMWAANGEALARHDYRWIKRSAFRMSLLGLVLVGVGGAVLVLASDTIMRLWIGRTFGGQHLVLAFVVASSAVVAATSPYNMVLNAMGRVSVQIWAWLAFVLISISLKLALVRPDATWHIAAVTGLVYVVTVTPAVCWSARHTLATLQSRRTI